MQFNLQWQKTDQWLPGDRVEEGLDYNRKQETFGDIGKDYLDYRVCFMGVYNMLTLTKSHTSNTLKYNKHIIVLQLIIINKVEKMEAIV